MKDWALSADKTATVVSTGSDSLLSALDPQSVAIIGASENPNKIGGRPLAYLSRFGYRGRIYPVNPSRAEVQGFRSYSNVASLPEAPDLAIVAVQAQDAVISIDECAARGVKVAIVMASGFGEIGDDAGVAAQQAMVVRARAAGMRIVGPNSQGLANFGTGAIASFSTMFTEVEPADGPVAIVSQSGIMSVVPYGLLRNRGIGVRHAHATGNEADVTLAELALAVARDPMVRLLLLYMETIRDPHALARAAEFARGRDLPIVAVKAGRTAAGHAAARSHTGALATEDRMVDAFLRHHGILRVRDIHGLVSATDLYLKGWRPRQRKLVVISNSGATCVMAADLAEELQLPLAPLEASTVASLAEQLPSFATTTNPIDITAALLNNSRLFTNVLPILARDPGPDLYFIGIPVAGAGYDVDAFARDTAEFARVTGKPVVAATPQPSVAERFRNAGIPTFARETEAIGALAQLVSHVQLMLHRPRRSGAKRDVRLPEGTDGFLNEAESLALLSSCSLPVVPHRLCRSAEEATDAFSMFGPAVALKACSRDVPHKADYGLVLLNLTTKHDVADAFDRLWRQLGEMNVRRDGVIVAEMVTGLREFTVGARVDPIFGPVVLIGDGGKYVEALGDVRLIFPPFSAADVEDALATLRIAPLLKGVRGEPPLDIEALCGLAVGVSEIIVEATGRIQSLDLNPVSVRSAGQGVVIVDALIERGLQAPAQA